MAKGSLLRTPSIILNSILVITIQSLNQIDMFPTTILPMEFTDFSIIMEEIETAFAAATTAGVDFAYSTGRDGDFVNFLFRE